jgi:hypothetical protein
MGTFNITGPDGKTYRVQGPTAEGAAQALHKMLAGQGQDSPDATPDAAEGVSGRVDVPVGDVGGLSGHAVQGALLSFGDEYLAGLSAVAGLQPDGEGGADWFQYDKPLGERYATALEQIRMELGDYREENPGKALAANVAGAIGTLPAAASIAPFRLASTPGRALGQMALAGAGGGAVEGFGAGEGGVANRLKSSGIGAGIGIVAAPLAGWGINKVVQTAQRLGGPALRRVFSRRQMFDPQTGRLSEEGRRAVRTLGFDPDTITDELAAAASNAADTATGGPTVARTPEAMRRAALGQRFDMPLSRGQATGDPWQQSVEQDLLHGARGRPAQDTMRGFEARQMDRVGEIRNALAVRAGPDERDVIDAAEDVIAGVRREAEGARRAGSAAYQAVEDAGAGVRRSSIDSLSDRIARRVSIDGVTVDAGTPNAQGALSILRNTFEGAGEGSIPFTTLERARSRMLTLQRAAKRGGTGADQIAMDNVVRAYDDWLDDTINMALEQGDDAVLDSVKDARRLWREYRQTFLSREGRDNYIRRIVEEDLEPDDVARWLFGASRKIGGGTGTGMAKRLKEVLGPDSDEFNAVRRAAWDRVTGGDLGPQAMATNIREMVDGKGKTLARELFTPAELAEMREFADLLKVMVPDPRATNPSKTSYALARIVKDNMATMTGALFGGATGGPMGAAAGAEGARQAFEVGGSWAAGVQARAAARGMDIRPVRPLATGIVGAATGGGLQEQFAPYR